MHISMEYDNQPPLLPSDLKPWKLVHHQDEALSSWLHRHDMRFHAMKAMGQWQLSHPWYECFVTERLLLSHLDELLVSLPLFYANILQIVPIAPQHSKGFLMMPDGEKIFALMVLNPGLVEAMVPACIAVINALDTIFLPEGKRYLSGFVGLDLKPSYWQAHFGNQYEDWLVLKSLYDPKGIFCSFMLPA